jgi:hypothetical protein
MSAKRILLLVFGSLLALLGLAVAIGGATALIAYGVGRDEDGYFTTSTERFQTPRYALVSEEVDLGSEGDAAGPVSLGDLARVRLRAESATGRPIFVGIGPRDDVRAYLDGAAYDEVTNVDFDPFRVDYRAQPGARTPAPPAEQDFWAARAEGSGRQTLDWELEGGTWALVVMNADAAPSVAGDLQLGVKIKILLPLGIGLLAGGLVVLGIGAVMIVFGARGGRAGPPPATDPSPGDTGPRPGDPPPAGDPPARTHDSPY